MSRLFRVGGLGLAVACIAALTSCSSGNPVAVVNYPVPTIVVIVPTGSVSLELGTTQIFTGAAEAANRNAIAQPISYLSSNPQVVSIASTGLACAGRWDSLTNPQICTPGPVGSAQITAEAQGVVSQAVTVYTHQHVDNIQVSMIPGQNIPAANVAAGCFSKGQTFNFQANAFSQGVDITSSVGPFSWQATSATVAAVTAATLTSPINGLLAGQAEIQANVPGLTTVFANLGSVNSAPFTFETCPVQSINLLVNDSTLTNFTVPAGTSKKIQANVFDSAGVQIYGVPLTFCTSQPTVVSIGSNCVIATASTTSQVGATETTGAPGAGNAVVTASCSPTACNFGFTPSMPVYAQNIVSYIVTSNQAGNGTLYVSSTGCGATQGCTSVIAPVTQGSNAVGSYVPLPATPNSMVFARSGANAYLGIANGTLGTKGVMEIAATSGSPSVTQDPEVIGKVIGLSPDATQIAVSDTFDTPNQLFIINMTGGVLETYQINGATAVDFSNDSLKGFVLAGSNLYVYSKIDALKQIPLAAPGVDVSFLANSAFGYIAEAPPGGGGLVEIRRTCDDGAASTPVSLAAAPLFIKALSNGNQVVVLDPPYVDMINVTAAPTGCSPTVSNTLQTTDLGMGTFAATQMIVSGDESKLYIVVPGMSSILVFDLFSFTTSGIPLTNNALPVQAALSSDGATLYVAASDGTVHVLSTTSGGDLTQINFPENLCLDSSGNPSPIPCAPNLLAFKP